MMDTIICPRCGTENPANAMNCKNCRINLKFALERPDEVERVKQEAIQAGDSKPKKKGMFAKIETRDDALKTIKETSIGFLVVAGIQGTLGVFLAPSILFDAALYAILGLVLMKWRARTAAVLLLLLSVLTTTATVMNKLGIMSRGGANIILALGMLWAAVRAVEATFKLHGKFAEKST